MPGKLRRFGRRSFLIAWLLIAASAASLLVGRMTSRTLPPSYQRMTFRSGLIFSARFGADGQTVVYSAAWQGRPSELFVTEAGSHESRSLGLRDARLLAISSTNEMALLLKPQVTTWYVHRGTLARAPWPAASRASCWRTSRTPTGRPMEGPGRRALRGRRVPPRVSDRPRVVRAQSAGLAERHPGVPARRPRRFRRAPAGDGHAGVGSRGGSERSEAHARDRSRARKRNRLVGSGRRGSVHGKSRTLHFQLHERRLTLWRRAGPGASAGELHPDGRDFGRARPPADEPRVDAHPVRRARRRESAICPS